MQKIQGFLLLFKILSLKTSSSSHRHRSARSINWPFADIAAAAMVQGCTGAAACDTWGGKVVRKIRCTAGINSSRPAVVPNIVSSVPFSKLFPLLIQSLPFHIKLSHQSEQWGKRPASAKAAAANIFFFELQDAFGEGTVAELLTRHRFQVSDLFPRLRSRLLAVLKSETPGNGLKE